MRFVHLLIFIFISLTIAPKDLSTTELSHPDLIAWIDLTTVPKVHTIQSKDELRGTMRDHEFLILGYSSSIRSSDSMDLSSLEELLGKLALALKSLVIKEGPRRYAEIVQRSQLALSTRGNWIKKEFGLKDLQKDAIIVAYKIKEDESELYSVLVKHSGDENKSINISPIIKSLKKLIIDSRAKDEL